MSFLTIASCLLLFVYDSSAVDIMPKLKRNILNFGYGVNFKYEGMLSHSFDRFYIVMKFELPKTKDLRLATFKFDFECSYANHTSSNTNYAKCLKYWHEDHAICPTLPKTDTDTTFCLFMGLMYGLLTFYLSFSEFYLDF